MPLAVCFTRQFKMGESFTIPNPQYSIPVQTPANELWTNYYTTLA
jgi:hypothetical protein